jgi:hypothetical protein
MPHYPNQVFELSFVGFETLFFFAANVVKFSIEIEISHVGSSNIAHQCHLFLWGASIIQPWSFYKFFILKLFY